MVDVSGFDSALYGVCEKLRRSLMFLPEEQKSKTEEIRLRNGLPLALNILGQTFFLSKNGQTHRQIRQDTVTVTEEDVNETFRLLCDNSVYAHTGELENGYIMMHSGCRAGICGTINEAGSMQDISSINIRVARQVKGTADTLLKYYKGGLLIAGPPASGKTTVLRDLIRQLSNLSLRVAVIDNRGELSGSYRGKTTCDLGKNSDVLIIKDKAKGIEIATRTMNPQIIAFDEIARLNELEALKESFFSGVDILTTAHIGCKNELMTRSVTRQLILSGAVSSVAVLSHAGQKDIPVFDVKEIICGTDT